MNARTSICTAFLLTLVAAVQPGWAQLIDPATQFRAPLSTTMERRPYDVRTPGMNPEVVRPGGFETLRRSEIRHVSPTVIEQIGKVKQSMPSAVGVR
jgi:hypothetical protein